MTFFVIFTASMVAGTWIMRPLGVGRGMEGYAYRALAGLAVCSLFLLVASPFLSLDGSFNALLVAAFAGVGYEVFAASRRRRGEEAGPSTQELKRSYFNMFCAAIVGVSLTISLIQALAPITEPVILKNQLSLAAVDGQANRILAHPEYPGGPPAPLLHTFFALALAYGEEYSASLISWIYGVIACAVVYGLARRFGGSACGWLAAAMLASAPMFLTQTGSPRVDLTFATYILASLSCLLAWRNEGKFGWLVMSAAFAGVGCALSPAGYLLVAVLACAVLMTPQKRRMRAAIAHAGAALCAALPWFLYGYLPGGGGGLITHFRERLEFLALNGVEELPFHPARAFFMFPWDVVMRPPLYGGWAHSPGPLLILFGIPGLIAGPKEGRLLGVYCVAAGGLLFFLTPSAQHFLPLFLPMIVVAAWAYAGLKPLRGLIITLAGAALLTGVAYQALEVRQALPAVLGQTARDEYLAEHIRRYPVYQWLNQNVPRDRAVLTFDPSLYYLEVDARTPDSQLDQLNGRSFERQMRWLADHRVRYLVWPETFIAENQEFLSAEWYGMVRRWPNRENHFRLLKEFVIPRPGHTEPEQVRIYEIHYNEDSA